VRSKVVKFAHLGKATGAAARLAAASALASRKAWAWLRSASHAGEGHALLQRPLKVQYSAGVIIAILIALIAGTAGYYLRELRGTSMSLVPREQVPPLDDYFAPQSFSEAENAKALLDALANRYLAGVLIQCSSRLYQPPAKGAAREPNRKNDWTEIIKMIDKGVEEFEGTPQQLHLLEALLFALKHEQLYDRWIEVYLRVLYEHPTHHLVGEFAKEAIIVGRATGREAEILTAFRHVSNIPLDFEAKQQVRAALLVAVSDGHVAWSGTDRSAQ
jgi:hypothetical protein